MFGDTEFVEYYEHKSVRPSASGAEAGPDMCLDVNTFAGMAVNHCVNTAGLWEGLAVSSPVIKYTGNDYSFKSEEENYTVWLLLASPNGPEQITHHVAMHMNHTRPSVHEVMWDMKEHEIE